MVGGDKDIKTMTVLLLVYFSYFRINFAKTVKRRMNDIFVNQFENFLATGLNHFDSRKLGIFPQPTSINKILEKSHWNTKIVAPHAHRLQSPRV